MAFIQLIASIIILGLLYRRMLSRNPEPVERKQAIVPVILGVVSLPLSLIFVLGGSVLLFRIGYKGEGVQPILCAGSARGLFNPSVADLLDV